MSDTLARYAFLPWLRRGIAAKIKEDDNFNVFSPPTGWAMERPEFQLKLKIEGKKGSTVGNDEVNQNISLIGPGDVLGVSQKSIVKHEPDNWITNYEPNYFPYIEFYEEDFPWRYSPARPSGNKLRPWLMLVVLEETEFEREDVLSGPLPAIKVFPHATDSGTTGATSTVWPNVAETWAWAHVHFNGDIDPDNNLNPTVSSDMGDALTRFLEVVGTSPDRAVSRIICPRKLSPNTTYTAFLVPTFEAGRLAGLGADAARLATVRAQDPAFGVAHAADKFEDRWPVYFEWFFKTGASGDFEHLVRQIVPRPVDPRVGKRPMDIQEAGYNVNYTGAPPFDGTLDLEGALMAPGTSREAYPWSGSNDFRKRLQDLLNLSEDLMKATFPSLSFYYLNNNPYGYASPEPLTDDPIITPDLYGRWHALKNSVSTTNNKWFHELNLDPRNRAVAGLGTKFIRKNQDALMDKAWEQMGDVIEANRKLNWGQFSAQVSNAGYVKHIASQPAEQTMAMTSSVMGRVKIGAVTMQHKVQTSALPMAMESSTFRRIQRPKGSVMRRIDPTNQVFTQNNLRVDVASANMAAVAPNAVSTEQAYLPGNNVTGYLNSVTSFPTNTAIFGLSTPGGSMVPNLAEQNNFQTAVANYQNYFEPANWPDDEAGPALDLTAADTALKDYISPLEAISRRAYHFMESTKPLVMPAPDRIVPVMAYPVFNKAMYEGVKELGTEFLIPNLNLIPNNTITLLETNQRFVESFMVGANHEMGRELLWREFPTDQRGSYFRQFWDSVDMVNESNLNEEDLANSILDIEEIHSWSSVTSLGTHNARPGINANDKLVLVLRGDLLKKYPNVVIYAQKAKWKPGDTLHELARDLDTETKYPVFSAQVDPDIHFLGFDLTEDEARGDRPTAKTGWFFVLMERPGEIRFGVDVPPSPSASYSFDSWNDLHQDNANFSGQHLSTSSPSTNPGSLVIDGVPGTISNSVAWGGNSTNFAQILYQNPVMVCIHAHEMLPTP